MDIRDRLLELVEEGIIDRDALIMAFVEYLTADEIMEMMEFNEMLDLEEFVDG